MRSTTWLRAAGLGLVLSVAAGAHAARAQSFNCEAAFSAVEQMICSDKELSRLDVDLEGAYKAAARAPATRGSLVAAQRAWLARRDACADRACVHAAYEDRLAVLRGDRRTGWVAYRNAALGIAFERSADRQVGPCRDAPAPNCVALLGAFRGRTIELAAFQVFDGPLETVATDQAGFEPQADGRWMTTYGRSAPHQVERFSAGGLAGMRSTVTCGISDETGFHAAAGECIYVVVSNGRRSVVASTNGVGGADAATARTIASLRIER
jgi:uncharacterized protein YecT (DUF1311 family)